MKNNKKVENKGNNRDNFSRCIAVLSFVLSIAAFIFPIYQHYQEQKEIALININNISYKDNVIITKNNFGEEGQVIQLPWKFTISNSGNRKLSITEYDISSGQSLGAVFYSGIKGELMKLSGEVINLPITLDAGESISGIIYIGVIVPKKVVDIINNLNDKSNIKYNDLIRILARSGFDIYGNKVKYKEYGEESYTLEVEKEQQKSQAFWIEFKSGRGIKFINSASIYYNNK